MWKEAELKNAFKRDLPGIAAHDLVMSYPRPSVEEMLESNKETRVSAVVFLLYPKSGQWHFLLLKRHEYAGVHSGQVGFPGGSLNLGENEKQAALRELHEESGLLISEKDLISALTPLYIPPSNFIVYHYAGLISQEPTWRFDPDEVKRGIEVPLKELVRTNNLKDQMVKMSGTGISIKVKSFPFGNEIVWGATAMILSECKEILKNLAE